MKVIICGAGQVGYGIAERLAYENNDVTVIDNSNNLIHRIRDELDVCGIVGHGSQPDVLSAARAEDADMIIAATLYDEVNMVACQVAHSLFDVPTKIARIRAQPYLESHWSDLFSREHMPIDVIISPEVEVGEMVMRRIALPGATDAVRFADGEVSMIAIECLENCPVIDTPLGQLSELFPDLSALVVGIWRSGNLFVPRSSDVMIASDLAYVIVRTDRVRRTLNIFGHEEQAASRIVIMGGGNIGLYVASAIETRQPNAKVKIIENSRERAVLIANNLLRTIVLHGNALDQQILLEADIENADLMVALTNDDQINILSSVMSKRLGCQSSLTLLNNTSYYEFTKNLGIDAHLNPRSVTISKILQHVRRGRIRSVHSVQNGAAEIIEAEALETSPLLNTSIRSLSLPNGVRIGAIYRDNVVVVPNGNTVVKAHDRIIIFATADRLRQVEQMFRVSLEFF
ncbi:Trk system potassium transporter TrkA [Candidatus Endowatersipora endosymbiont of Watersipora subatra]|uniref:Trk system potassium transporter TrkA n=1 Tax=Candidatus Endowatersipora endosymbiont of Watersipora subatra TaxID=3077946 RepID=UPI00312CB656